MRANSIFKFDKLQLRKKALSISAIWGVRTFRFVLITGISFIILYPVLSLVSKAFMVNEDILDPSVSWLPRHFTLNHFKVAFEILDYFRSSAKSLSLTAGLSVIEVLVSMIIGYGLARFKFKGSRIVFGFVILTLIVPPSILSVPLFLNFRYFSFLGIIKKPINLIGTVWPMIFMALTGTAKRNGLFIYLAMQYYRGLDTSLEEAAYVDGSGILNTFFKLIIPNSTSILLVIFLFSFVWLWNDLFYSTFFLKGMDLLVLNLQSFNDRMNNAWATLYINGSHITLVSSASSLLFILPSLIIYAFMQKYFVESIEKSGLVG